MMPGIPQMFGKKPSESDSFESDSELNTPSHDEEVFKKPEIVSPDQNSQTHVAIPLVSKKGIEVVAQRKGFYNQMRYREGDRFFIKNESEFGEWMKCVENVFEKKRIEFYKNKKAKK